MSEPLTSHPFHYPDAAAKERAVKHFFDNDFLACLNIARHATRGHKIPEMELDIMSEWCEAAQKCAHKFDVSRVNHPANTEFDLWKPFLKTVLNFTIQKYLKREANHLFHTDSYDSPRSGEDGSLSERNSLLDYHSYRTFQPQASFENLFHEREYLTLIAHYVSREEWDLFCAYFDANDGKDGRRELAKKLQISYDALRQRYSRIRSKLKQAYNSLDSPEAHPPPDGSFETSFPVPEQNSAPLPCAPRHNA